MPTRHVLKSKKAISPILATLLLIVIAVAAIVVTYAWIMTYMGSAGQQIVMMSKENVRFDANLTEITIGNTGTVDTRILRIYVGNSSENMIELTSYTDIGSGKPLLAGSIAVINLSWPNALAVSWESGKTYYFKIVPAEGQFLPFQERAPF